MSRTIGHSDPRRSATDFYATPEWCTEAVVGWLRERHFDLGDFNGVKPPATILDPGAGSGAITQVLRREWSESYIECWEIEDRADLKSSPDFNYVRISDFLGTGARQLSQVVSSESYPLGRSFDLCVCNPPFSGPNREDLALAFIKRAMEWSKVGAFLVRLNWLAAAPTKAKHARYKYLKANPPCVLVMGKRPSFTHGGTDATEYCWLVFGIPGTGGRWELLDCGWEENP